MQANPRQSRTLDSTLWIQDSETWTPDSYRLRDSGFLEQDSAFHKPKILGFRNPDYWGEM